MQYADKFEIWFSCKTKILHSERMVEESVEIHEVRTTQAAQVNG